MNGGDELELQVRLPQDRLPTGSLPRCLAVVTALLPRLAFGLAGVAAAAVYFRLLLAPLPFALGLAAREEERAVAKGSLRPSRLPTRDSC